MAPRRAAALRDPVDSTTTLRDHLVAVTDALLDEAPIGTLTTRQIARSARVSDGVLYNYFGDKEELILAAVLRRYARLIASFELAAPTVGRESLEAGLQGFAHALCDLEAGALLLGAGLLADQRLLERFWTEIHRLPFGLGRLRQPLTDYLAGERDAGGVDPAIDIEAVITLVFGASGTVALTKRLNPGADAAELDARLDAAVATIVSGIAPRR
jgi:AcrR family transcriptional regulator